MTTYRGYTKKAHKRYSNDAEFFVNDYKEKYPNYHTFDKETLKFFGERISDMRILKSLATVTDYSDEKHECYVLSTFQRNHPDGARRKYRYFDVKNLKDVLAKEIKK